MTAAYDLTTARGVLLALADGHTLTSENGSVLRVKSGCLTWTLERATNDICLATKTCVYSLAPKAVESMDVPELAVELYGEAVEADDHAARPCIWQSDVLLMSAPTRADLLKQLRVLLRAKRAGEL